MDIRFQDAEELIASWLSIVNKRSAHRRAVMEEQTVAKPYGWMFVLQHERFVVDRNPDFLLYGGHQNILITKDGAIHVLRNTQYQDILEYWESTVGATYVGKPAPPEIGSNQT